MFFIRFICVVFLLGYFPAYVFGAIGPNYANPQPDLTRLESVVRLKITHGRQQSLSDIAGVSLAFETRDRVTKDLAWGAEVLFGACDKRGVILYSLYGENHIIPDLGVKPSLILVNYIVAGNYPSTNFPSTPIRNTRDNGCSFRVDMGSKEITINESSEFPQQQWIRTGLFEWPLQGRDSWRVIDLIDFLNQERYKLLYTLTGVSSNGNAINCCQLFCRVLRDLEIPLGVSADIRDYGFSHSRVGLIRYLLAKWTAVRPEYIIKAIAKAHPLIPNTKVVIRQVRSQLGHPPSFEVTRALRELVSVNSSTGEIRFLPAILNQAPIVPGALYCD